MFRQFARNTGRIVKKRKAREAGAIHVEHFQFEPVS